MHVFLFNVWIVVAISNKLYCVICLLLIGVRLRGCTSGERVNFDIDGDITIIVTFKASIHSMSKTLPGGEFDWGGTSPKQ